MEELYVAIAGLGELHVDIPGLERAYVAIPGLGRIATYSPRKAVGKSLGNHREIHPGMIPESVQKKLELWGRKKGPHFAWGG